MTALQRSEITTEDGTVIMVDPRLGVAVSGRSRQEVEAEIARRLGLKSGRKAA